MNTKRTKIYVHNELEWVKEVKVLYFDPNSKKDTVNCEFHIKIDVFASKFHKSKYVRSFVNRLHFFRATNKICYVIVK